MANEQGSRFPNIFALLFQIENFDDGTFIIDRPGAYKLCEDITFGPNGPAPGQTPAADAFDPIFDGTYDENAFGLGFFAAIAIASPNVDLYLNEHTIQQSRGHALMQRFFAVVELASAPFISGVGPAEFVGDATLEAASNIRIVGPGTIGRSSHHGKLLSSTLDSAIFVISMK